MSYNNITTTTSLQPNQQLVIFAYGNLSRGDDALAPILLHQIKTICQNKQDIEFIEDFQLQIEHALDLEHHDLALFIDASVSGPAPFSFTLLTAKQDNSYTSHALHPAAILYTYQQIQGQLPPPAFLLTVRGESFQLGEPLSKAATYHLTAAFEFVKQLCQIVEISAWQQLTTTSPHES